MNVLPAIRWHKGIGLSPDIIPLLTPVKKTGKDYAISTNTDIYFYDLHSGKSTNMTEGMMGYDMNPCFLRTEVSGMDKHGAGWL